jgi:hypothetical protein
MSIRDDVERAADDARAQVEAARTALAATRAAVAGAPARTAKEAERQLAALRGGLEQDLRALRSRVLDAQGPEGGRLRSGLAAGAAGVAGLVGVGLLGRSLSARRSERRQVDRQAAALAGALAARAASAASSAATAVAAGAGWRARSSGPQGGRDRRGGGTLKVLLVGAAVAAGAAALRARRDTPIDPDDLWLPERPADAF